MSILGVEIGVAGCTAVVYRTDGAVLGRGTREYPLMQTEPGAMELGLTEPRLTELGVTKPKAMEPGSCWTRFMAIWRGES